MSFDWTLDPAHPSQKAERLDKKFLTREFIAGLSTFLTMSYIVVVNPAILSTEGTGMSFSGVLTATVLLCFVMTLFMGLYAKLPYAVAPGMGINAFFTFSLILGEKIPWQTALGMVFWAGVFFLLISITPIREKLATAIPRNIRIASAVGIGLFLTLIGFKNAGIIVSDPVTFVTMGKLEGAPLLSLIGLLVIIPLMKRKNPLAFIAGILAVTATTALSGELKVPASYFSLPDFTSVFMQLDIWGALKLSLLPAILSVLFTDLFDSISTFMGVSQAGNLLDKRGNPLRLKEGLVVDAFATLGAGLAGTSSGTAYIESATGVEAGGRTGWTSVFCALLFLPCFFLAPLLGSIPPVASAPVLIVVGLLMFQNIKELELKNIEDSLPAFLTLVLTPLTFSITKGLLWGFLSHTAVYVLTGKAKSLTWPMWILGAFSLWMLFFTKA